MRKSLIRIPPRLLVAVGFLSLSCAFLAAQNSGQPMNVIMILSDDLGWADTSLQGRSDFYETPHLERLAEQGISFNRGYAASPLCSPTRASIMTGQNPARIGLTSPRGHLANAQTIEAQVLGRSRPDDKSIGILSAGVLDNRLPTLAKQVKAAGYATGHFGKWHLGLPPYSPLQHGFDVDIPHWPGPGPAGNFVVPWSFRHIEANHPKEHIEDRMAEEAVAWIEKQVAQGQAFYMHYWQFSVHAPFDAKEEYIEMYRQRLTPGDHTKSPTYAAMVKSMDDSIGALMDVVERLGIAENTAILFFSDNGGNMYNGITEIDAEGKEYVVAPTTNAPLRGGKASMWDGGTRVPAVFYWPGLTPAGVESDALIQTTDLYPTILNLLEIPLPENHPLDGIDFSPAMRGEAWERSVGMITYFPHNPPVPDWLPPSISIHHGDWKLIRLFYYGDEPGEHQYLLFNLAEDIGEQNNLAEQYPERVRALDRMIEDYIVEANVLTPVPNPEFDPARFDPSRIGVQPGGLRIAQTREERVARILGQNRPQAARQSPPPARDPVGSQIAQQWQAGRDTVGLRVEENTLRIDSTGIDPWVFHELRRPVTGGGLLKLSFEIHTSQAGMIRVYGRDREGSGFSPDDVQRFNLDRAGQWVEVSFELAAGPPLHAVRISPPGTVGESRLRNIRLEDASGRVVHRWF
jgi:arylsulfatase A-like enzyme